MKNKKKSYLYILPVIAALASCNADLSEELSLNPKGGPAEVYVSLHDISEPETRVVKDATDTWSNQSFSTGDVVGMYSLKGRQNPADENLFDQSVINQPMYYEGRIGNSYKFSNPDIILDPQIVKGSYSIMYHPYFEEMPTTTLATTSPLKGIPLRQRDTDGIEKCTDFMYTNTSYISMTNGMLQPTFYHYNGIIGIQRGDGFENAVDRRVWVVCQSPYTDIRIRQSSATSSFSYSLLYHPEEGEEVMQTIVDERPDLVVNKYRVWQGWQGNQYQGKETFYVMVPPGAVSYILMQDNYGNWQAVSDFYLNSSGSKTVSSYNRYLVTAAIKGSNVLVRPVLIEDWDDEIKITDDRKVGIQSPDELAEWIRIYNAYIGDNRSEDYVERLKYYGDGRRSGEDGPVSWTFYINSNLELENGGNYQITQLDDVLEGSSVYTNYKITNLRHTLIKKMGSKGELRSLAFDGLYIIDSNVTSDSDVCGGLIEIMEGGNVENIEVNNGIIVSDKKVGMLAGSISKGGITDCVFSGDVIGRETADGFSGLFGEIAGNPEEIKTVNNNIRDLNFTNYQ